MRPRYVMRELHLPAECESSGRSRSPENWVATRDTGYVVEAHDPDGRAFVRLLFQHWWTQGSGPATAHDYVQYWHDFVLGDVFPVDARGQQISKTEVGHGKVGGPYLRYEFEDAPHATRYVQVYASAGGVSSIVFTGWARARIFRQWRRRSRR